MIKAKIFILVLFLSLFSAAFSASNQGDILMNKPYITMHIDINGCTYQVLVNDVPIMSDADGIPVTVDLPVNEWLKSGANSFSLKLGPVKDAKALAQEGQNCHAIATLQVREFGASNSSEVLLSKLDYQSTPTLLSTIKSSYQSSTEAGKFAIESDKLTQTEKGNIEIGSVDIQKYKGHYGQGVELKRSISLPLPFPKWAWLSSDKIPDDQQTKAALIQQYKRIWEDIQSKNIKAIAPLFSERIREYSAAYFQPQSDMNVVKEIENAANNNSLELGAFIPKYEYLHVFGDGRLAKLTTWDGSASIYFNYKNEDMSENFDLIFRKSSDKWIITR